MGLYYLLVPPSTYYLCPGLYVGTPWPPQGAQYASAFTFAEEICARASSSFPINSNYHNCTSSHLGQGQETNVTEGEDMILVSHSSLLLSTRSKSRRQEETASVQNVKIGRPHLTPG
eukprot:6491090-Amphidinium_carterae.2